MRGEPGRLWRLAPPYPMRRGKLKLALIGSWQVTVTLRCLNCGFTFTVTYPTIDAAEKSAKPTSCGHCRSTRWSWQSA